MTMRILDEAEIQLVSGGEEPPKKPDDPIIVLASIMEAPVNEIKILPPPTQDPVRK